MKLKALVIVLLSAFLISACGFKTIKHGTEITNEQVDTIVNGETTRDDIIIKFGDPSKTMNNEKAYFYSWTRGSKSSFIGLGGGSAYTKSLVVIFDDNGLVKNHKITRGTTKADTAVVD